MIRILINGINGQMGTVLKNVINSSIDTKLFGGIDLIDKINDECEIHKNPFDFEDIPDVIIDFSKPVATMNILDYAMKKRIPLVIATTGFSEEQLRVIKNYSKYIPIFKSSNMSYEINLMANILKQITPLLKDADIEIVESHHNRKIDSPSGTAILLADSINSSVDNTYIYEFDRHNKNEKRSKNEIGFSSIRGGNIVGEHSVLFIGKEEIFELTHKAYSREVFAEGSIKAAKYIINKEPGIYDMNDMINEN